MGRIKTSLIKRTAKELKKIFNFDEDFEKNKILLNGIIESKRLRNILAGYLTRLKKEEKQR